MGKQKSTNPFPGYIRVSEPDKDKLAELVCRAKGDRRTVTEFAHDCGVSPSTISRIINMKTSGANSDDLIESIFEHADPDGGVKLSELLKAHGLMRIDNDACHNNGMVTTLDNFTSILNNTLIDQILIDDSLEETKEAEFENAAREIIVNELFNRGYTLSLKMEHNLAVAGTPHFIADFAIATNALEAAGIREWAFDIMKGKKSLIIDKLSRIFSAAYLHNPFEHGIKISLVTNDAEEIDDIERLYRDVKIKDSISIILIDNFNKRVMREFQIPMTNDKEPVYVFGEDMKGGVPGGQK